MALVGGMDVIRPEDCDCKGRRNVGTALTNDEAKPRKPELHISSVYRSLVMPVVQFVTVTVTGGSTRDVGVWRTFLVRRWAPGGFPLSYLSIKKHYI
jgi:hypothetical protein